VDRPGEFQRSGIFADTFRAREQERMRQAFRAKRMEEDVFDAVLTDDT
jgi:hypothetical protein